ncbi:MAG TPA: glycosyltransferase family 2 protein, partial [Actinomycetota bacterium]
MARATRALAAHHPHLGYEVLLVEDGAGEVTGRALEDLAHHDPHVRVLHLDPAIGFGAAMNLAMGQALGRVLVWLDPHVEATGDLLGPLLAALERPGTGLAGGWGVTTTTMLDFEADDGPEVDAVEGYLLAVPRALAARVGVDPKDRYYRNADLDYSFAVRALGYPAVRGTPSEELSERPGHPFGVPRTPPAGPRQPDPSGRRRCTGSPGCSSGPSSAAIPSARPTATRPSPPCGPSAGSWPRPPRPPPRPRRPPRRVSAGERRAD